MRVSIPAGLKRRGGLSGVRLRAEATVAEEGAAVELRGVLDSISNRFYTGGWGYGVLYTDSGYIQITGTLEGHVKGTSLIVRGAFKESSYGRQLECSSIIVDQVSGDLTVIRSWARKYVKDHEAEIVAAARRQPIEERWTFLCNRDALVGAGLAEDVAVEVAQGAKLYLILIETKKELMAKGFTDNEAEKLCQNYGGSKVMGILEQDPYAIVIDRVLAFTRIDTVVDGKVPRNLARRLHAALVQALVSAQRNGHMACDPRGATHEAAGLAGVYQDAIQAAGLPTAIVQYDGKLQLRSAAYSERDIAEWVMAAMKLEEST